MGYRNVFSHLYQTFFLTYNYSFKMYFDPDQSFYYFKIDLVQC